MKEFLAAFILIGFGVLGMCVTILFRKNGQFPNTDVGSNPVMRKMGIRCAKEEDQEMWNKKLNQNATRCGGEFNSPACSNCGYFEEEKKLRGILDD